MTTPSGLLAWGQQGQFNAVDDRSVITALANLRNGLVKPVALAPVVGLTVNIAPGWLGVADCGDATSAIVGSRIPVQVTVPAGPATGSTTSYIWCDVNPDASTWTINVITPAQAAGRSGLQLGTVVAPANSNLASQMTLTPYPVSFAEVEGITFNTTQTNGRAYIYSAPNGMLYVKGRQANSGEGAVPVSLMDGLHRVTAQASDGIVTAKWLIPPGDLARWNNYEIETWGTVKIPTPVANFWFDLNLYGAAPGNTRTTVPSVNWGAGADLNWHGKGIVQIDAGFVNAELTLIVTLCNRVAPVPQGQNLVYCAFTQNIAINPANTYSLGIRNSLASLAGGACETWGSRFTRYGGSDPGPNIVP